MTVYHIGMVGLGVMGSNLARNLASHGFSVAGYDLAEEKRRAFEHNTTGGQQMAAFADVANLTAALEKPRRIILLVPDKVVDQAIQSLKPCLERGDLLIDLGNSNFVDTERRSTELEKEGFLFVGSGVSGGSELRL